MVVSVKTPQLIFGFRVAISSSNCQSKLETEFKELYGSNWRKSPDYIRAFERRKEARIREIAAMGEDESLVPSADSMLGD